MTRLVQLQRSGTRRVAIVEEPHLRLLDNCRSVYELADSAVAAGSKLSDAASGMKRRRKERVTSEAPARTAAWEPEGFPLTERSYSGKPGDGRRGAGKRYRFGKTTRKHEARASAASASQFRTARRKPRGATVAQARRASASNHSVNR